MIWKGCLPYRPHDYMYDPIFTVSGPVDHYKAAIMAKMSAAKFDHQMDELTKKEGMEDRRAPEEPLCQRGHPSPRTENADE